MPRTFSHLPAKTVSNVLYSGNSTNGSTVIDSSTLVLEGNINSIAFNVGYSVIQVAIGITVGLFLSAIVVYPLGKRRSGLFSF